MAGGEDTREFFQKLQTQLKLESSLLESHLNALESEFAKISNPEMAAAGLMQRAINMKRERLESIRNQLNNLAKS